MSELNASNWLKLSLTISAGLFAVVTVFMAAGMFADRQERGGIAQALTSGDASRALPLLRKYGCSGCHTIPGVPGADGQVGGPLSGLSARVYIGGVLTNSSDHLVGWIVTPQRFSPNTAMPVTGITESEARDVAAYLYQR
ncbi:Cytochrome c2 [Agrobacterium tumefaciens str. Kerr 14]|uniref:Cytochrome c2 n=2 Tax=Agrobacterium tumefaciens TaxID=358 RepID=A0A1S7SEL7_AGRTU|nr:Cytochrome c2 [Agrobacterium tumefaciens str. Kerr 14]